jgi:hypothetical protein
LGQYDTTRCQVDLHGAVGEPEDDSLLFDSNVLDEDWCVVLFDLADGLEFQKISRDGIFDDRDGKLLLETFKELVLLQD